MKQEKPIKKTRFRTKGERVLVTVTMQIFYDQNEALKKKGSKTSKQRIVQELLDQNGFCDLKLVG